MKQSLEQWLSSFPDGQKFTMKKYGPITVIRADGTDRMFIVKEPDEVVLKKIKERKK